MGRDDSPSYVLAAGIVIPVVCMGFTALRFYTRYKQKTDLRLDDWLTLPALVLVVACGGCLIAGVALGVMGYPTPPLDDPSQPETSSNYNIRTISKLEWAILTLQPTALGLTKMSFVFFYRRIFVARLSKRTTFGTITILTNAIIIAWTISYLFTNIFVCRGHWSAQWTNLHTLTTQCIKTSKMLLSLAITDFLTDLIVLILPIPKVFGLNMSLTKKFAVLGVFALGAVAIAMSIMRLYVFEWGTRVSFTSEDVDNNLLITRVLYWSVLEAGLALVACCLPAVKPSLQAVLDSVIKHVPSHISLSSLVGRGSRSSRSRQTPPIRELNKEPFHGTYGRRPQWENITSESQAVGNSASSAEVPDKVIMVDRSFELTEHRA